MIRADLSGDDTCTALGITLRSGSPVLVLCRKLVEIGHDPATPMDVYRGSTLALRVRSIGEAAGLQVASHSRGFIRAPQWRRGSLVSQIVEVVA
jgi:hypothetical protein